METPTQIQITCDNCHKSYQVRRTDEIPDNVVSLGCNYCPSCIDEADSYPEEWYNYDDGNNDNGSPNQLLLISEFDRIEQKVSIL